MHGGAAGASLLRRRKSVKSAGKYLVRDRVYFFLGQASEEVQKAEATAPLEPSLGRIFGELFSTGWSRFFPKTLTERLCSDEVGVVDGDVRLMFVRSGLITGGFCSNLGEYDGALNILRVWPTERCVLREHRVYDDQNFRAQKKLLNSFVLI